MNRRAEFTIVKYISLNVTRTEHRSIKFATLKDGTRDGQLIVVSRDLRTAAIADQIVPTLQRALDDWPFYAPQLMDVYVYEALNAGRARNSFSFDAKACMVPLPRAYRINGRMVRLT